MACCSWFTQRGEGFLQLLQAAMDQSGDGAGRAVQPLGDLGQRPAVPVLQHQGVAGVRRQLLQGVGQLQGRFLALDLLARRRLFGRQNASSRADEASSACSR